MHQDLIRAKTGLPLDFEWLEGAEQSLKPTVWCCQTNDCMHRIAGAGVNLCAHHVALLKKRWRK